MRFFIFFLLLVLVSPVSSAACISIASAVQFPAVLKPGACYEIRGKFSVAEPRTIAARLTVRTDSSLSLTPGTRLILAEGGELIVRGELRAEREVQFELNSDSKFSNHGVLYLSGGSRILTGPRAVFRNAGEFFLFQGSALSLGPQSSFTNASILKADDARLAIVSAEFENGGTIDLGHGSIMDFSGTSRVKNGAKFITRKGTLLTFRNQTHFANTRFLKFAGTVIFSDQAALHNDGIAEFEASVKMGLKGHGVIENSHVIDLYGQLQLSEVSLFNNLKNFQIKQGGYLEIVDNARLINESTVTDYGVVHVEHFGGLHNRHIFYVKGQRSHDNLYELLKKAQSPETAPPESGTPGTQQAGRGAALQSQAGAAAPAGFAPAAAEGRTAMRQSAVAPSAAAAAGAATAAAAPSPGAAVFGPQEAVPAPAGATAAP